MTYSYDYNFGEASITFDVDPEIFTRSIAEDILSFFGISSKDPIEEVMEMYAVECLMSARGLYFIVPEDTAKRFNRHMEGFVPVNRGNGIKIVNVDYSRVDKYDLKRVD